MKPLVLLFFVKMTAILLITQTVKWVFLPFKAMVCIKAFPQRPSKMEQLPTTGLAPLEIMSFKVMACLTNKAHPSEPHKSGFQEGNSLMPHLQTSPSRRKGKSFMSAMSPVFPMFRAGIRPFAGQACRAPQLGMTKFRQWLQTLIADTNFCAFEAS